MHVGMEPTLLPHLTDCLPALGALVVYLAQRFIRSTMRST